MIIWLSTRVEKSGGIGSNETHFSEAVEQGQKDFVSATVLGILDQQQIDKEDKSEKKMRFINGGVTLPRLVLKPISGLTTNDFPRDHFADRDGGGSGR